MTPVLSGWLRPEMGIAACQTLHWVPVDGNVAISGNQSPQRELAVFAWTDLIENKMTDMCITLSLIRGNRT